LSTTTETKNDFAESTVENAETVETVQQDGSTTTVTQETTSDQHEHHHHTNEDGTLSPLCSGGGCPDGTVK
jgi:3-dehydroquinate synthase class II